jgi:hypothetical protein
MPCPERDQLLLVPARYLLPARCRTNLVRVLLPRMLLCFLTRGSPLWREQTAKYFGAPITSADINKAKAAGGANNDWKLTHTLVHAHKGTDGASPSLQEITDKFEQLYQGEKGRPGVSWSRVHAPVPVCSLSVCAR